jgi:hypothetical protein
MEAARDIFDQFEEEDLSKSDVFDEIDTEDSAIENVKGQVAALLEKFDAKDRKNENRKLSDEIKFFIQSEISKIKPKQNVIERTIEKKIIEPRYLEPKLVESPPQIIKEVRVEVEKKDKTKYVEESKYLDLLVKISKLETQLKETRRMAESPVVYGGPGVIGIPPPEPNPDNYVLTTDKGKAKWKAASGGGLAAGTFSVTNNTPSYSFDPTVDSIDNLYQVVATLIRKLQGDI